MIAWSHGRAPSMTLEELNTTLATCPGDRVTPEYINSRIQRVRYSTVGTMTLCVLTLDNGYQVVGESACADPLNFNEAIGQKLAYDRAFNQLWPLFGFLLTERRYLVACRAE